VQERKSLSSIKREPMGGKASFDIHGLPRIATIHDLAAHSGISSRRLWYFAFAGRGAYTTFRLAKKSGGTRLIQSPSYPLRIVQRWILRNILDRLNTTSSSFGFERGSKLRFHALEHVGARAVLTLDIKDFFPSISVARVTQVYRTAGYPSSVASILAHLCTCRGVLPQGAPSSPRLANLACFRMDRRLSRFAERKGIVYSRYADDMSFSSSSASALAKARPFVTHIIRDSGFRLNRSKTRSIGPQGRKTVTGLVLAEDTVGIGRFRLRELRARIQHAHVESDSSNVSTIQGLLDYVSDADPSRYEILARYVERLRESNAAGGLKSLRIRPTVI
jgi:RNA-directed DNA polymerase